MESLYNYIDIEKATVNEGLIGPAMCMIFIKKLSPEELTTGILNMYDYIIDKTDIKLFYNDFNVKERLFWKYLYKLYENKLWSIFDLSHKQTIKTQDEEKDEIENCFDGEIGLINVTPEFRRELRNIVKQSSAAQENIGPANVSKIMLIDDPQFEKRYIFTINKILGPLKSLFKFADVKMLETLFMKISQI